MQETQTAAEITRRLIEFGYDVQAVGGGVVGVLPNGQGPTVLMRADIDALPVAELTGLPYTSTVVTRDAGGASVPLMHACGHDVHITSLLGAAQLLSTGKDVWSGTFIALFQPGEETAAGAKAMVDDGLTRRVPRPDVAFGAVVLAASIVLRLQTLVSRETKPGEFAVVTVGSSLAGTKSNIIPDRAVLLVNTRAYEGAVRDHLLHAIERIVRAECDAAGSPEPAAIISITVTIPKGRKYHD